MSVNTRKRGSAWLLEKPVVSRLAFEEERVVFEIERLVDADRVNLAPTAAAAGTGRQDGSMFNLTCTAENKRQKLSTNPEVATCEGVGNRTYSSSQQQISFQSATENKPQHKVEILEERSAAAAPWGTGGWLGPSRQAESAENQGCSVERSSAGRKVGGTQGPALVQLKIDTMFSGGSLTSRQALPITNTNTNNSGGCHEGPEGMDTDNGGAAATDGGIVRAEIGPTCYVCRRGMGSEGGDILCFFCDRAVCDGCSQSCCACELPHCSLCLGADFTSQFESYFCPPCQQTKSREACGGSLDGMLT